VLALALLAASAPLSATAQEQVFPAISSAGGAQPVGGLTVISATGQPSAVGVVEHGALRHNLGWVRWTPTVWDPDPLRIVDVHVEAVTPDSALVRFEATHPVVATLAYGDDDAYGSLAQTEDGTIVRLTGLPTGSVVHYRLTVTDRDGRERSTGDLILCTPSLEELEIGRLQASYYRGTSFDTHVLTRIEATIDQPLRSDNDRDGDFGSGAGPDNFSVRWTGLLNITQDAEYSWHGTADDGQRLFIDGDVVAEHWREGNRATQVRASQRLDASWHALRYDFFSGEGPATARLKVGGGDLGLRVLPTERLAYVTEDFYKPNFVPREEPIVFECEAPEGTGRKVLLTPEVYDCHDPDVSVTSNAPGSFPLGETRVVWTAVSGLGHQARFVEFVTVEDTRPPTVERPNRLSVEAESPQGTVVELPDGEASDVCDEAPTVEYAVCENAAEEPCQACWTEEDEEEDPARVAGERNPDCVCDDAPARFPLGVNVVTALAYDSAGNCADTRLEVEITDTTPPEIITGEVQIVQCSEFRIPRVTVRDNVSEPEDIIVTCLTPVDQVPGSCDRRVDLGYGDHLVLIAAIDEADNVRSDEVLIVQSRDQVDTDPPDLEVAASPDGWANGPGSVSVSALDFCDDAPTLTFAPQPDATATEEDVHTARYSAEGVYEVRATATDHADNVSTIDAPAFGIDLTPPTASFRGIDAADDPDDPLTWPVYFAGDTVTFSAGGSDTAGGAKSGIASVFVTLTHPETDTSRTLLATDLALDESAPPTGQARAKNLGCVEDVPEGEDPWCDGSGNLAIGPLPAGDFRLTVRVTDVAGNTGELALPFSRFTWRMALERADAKAQQLLAEDPSPLSALTLLFLGQIPAEIDGALTAADYPDRGLVGNALLYSYTFVSALASAEGEEADIGNTAYLVNRGAYVTVAEHYDYVVVEVGEDDPDVENATDYMQTALDHMESDPASPLASLLALMNAYFYLQHALEVFEQRFSPVETWADNRRAAQHLRNAYHDYQAIDVANGHDLVGQIVAEADAIHEGHLLTHAMEQGWDGHTAFLELLRRLNASADLMAQAQDSWVWVRNWQWPLSLMVRRIAGSGIDLVAEELGEDPLEPDDPLLAYARNRYNRGVELIDDRLVDEAMKLYVDERCLIYEVYNHGGFLPAGVPPEEWECPDCTLTGNCDH